jgi:hypothetical protein
LGKNLAPVKEAITIKQLHIQWAASENGPFAADADILGLPLPNKQN